MCDVCKTEKLDWVYTTGSSKLTTVKLYRIYRNKIASVKLCRLHDIELFQIGETRFLMEHLGFARNIVSHRPVASLD